MSRRPHEPKERNGESVQNTEGAPLPVRDPEQRSDTVTVRLPKLNKKQIYALVVGFLFIGSSAAFALYYAPSSVAQPQGVPEHVAQAKGTLDDSLVGPLGSLHAHFTLTVTLDGVAIDFSRAKYQLRDRRFHFEGGDGTTGHMHATGITLDYALRTLGMTLTSECFTLDGGRRFCNTEDKSLEMFVNGAANTEFEKYAPKDGDEIVIIYG